MLGGTFKMGVLLVMLLRTIVTTTWAKMNIVNTFEGDSTKGPFSHMVLDKSTGNVYIGAMNSLYQLSSNLTLIKSVTTGPKDDNLNCQPQNINAPCDQPKTPTNTYNKALVIDYHNHKLIACSSIYHGICERYNLSDIESKDPDNYVPVVANNYTSTTVAFIAPGPLDGSSKTEVLYVAASRTYAGQSLFPDFVPAIASRKLETFDLFYKGIHTSSSKSILAIHRDTFPVHYIYGFSSDTFSYFVTVQKQNPSNESYISKLIRVCQADKDYYSYAEVQLKCMVNGTHYNLVQAAYVGKAGSRLAEDLFIRDDEDVLYVVCSIGSPNTVIPLSDSALCIYPLRIIRGVFTVNIKACFRGRGSTGPSHIITEVACQKMNRSFNIDDDYCGTYGINNPIDGHIPIETDSFITFNTTVSAVAAVKDEYFDTIVFVGTIKGHIIKVLIHSKQVIKLIVEDGNKILADMIFDSNKHMLYVLTDTKIFNIAVGCASHKTCAQCVKDPECGWLKGSKKCSEFDGFNIRSIHLCTSSSHIFQDSMQKGSQENIQLEYYYVQFWIKYKCEFSYGNVSIKTQANITDFKTITCEAPSSNQLPPIQTGEDHIVMDLSLLGDGMMVWDTNFTIFDCSLHISCTSCTESNFPCTWCINNHMCTFNNSDCPDNKLVLGRTVTKRNDSRHIKEAQPCPRIQKSATDIFVPSGMNKKIVVSALNLMDFQTSLTCFFNLNNNTQVNANVTRLPNGESIIECDLVHFPFVGNKSDTKVPFYISWAINKSLDNPKNIQVIVYQCEMALSCFGCLTLNSQKECGWCENYCTMKSGCSSTWLSTAETCPNPEIKNIEPTFGPMDGGTKLTITGNNLGKRFEDVSIIFYIENRIQVQCIPVKDLYMAPQKIVCVTGASFINGTGKIVVTINSQYNATASHITFSYVNPVLVTISPSKGPKSGGTLVTLSGYHMNAGTKRTVWFGNRGCEVKSFNGTKIICVTSKASGKVMKELRVQFDNQMVTSNITYNYTNDPTVINIDPKVAIVSGGILIDVSGTLLNTIQEPKMVIWYGEKKFEEDCKTENATMMRCYSPQMEALKSNDKTGLTMEGLYSYGFIMDNVKEVLNLTGKDQYRFGTFNIVPNPIFESLTGKLDNTYLYVPDNDLIINAHPLSGVFVRHVTIKIGNGLCTDISVGTLQVICKPPKHQPKSLIGSTNPEVIVYIGRNFSKLVGYLRYQQDVPLPIIIGVTVGALVLVIIIFVVILVIKNRENKSMKKKWQTQMDILESNVNKECKEDNTFTSGASGPAIDKSTLSVLKDAKLIIRRNRLRLGDIIGKGHFGCVLKGYITLPGDKVDVLVAIKTLHKKNLRDIDVDAFLREIMIMKDFYHPNVIRLLGICLGQNDMPLMILPFMEHGDLLSYIRDDINTPTIKELVDFGIGIAEGVAYLSDHKFVHRDLAARNCMLDEKLNVKVADFGLSREIYEREYYSSDNKNTKLPIRWMAPESMEKGTYSSKSDVWSYGIALWELVTRGVIPYPEVDNWDILRYLQKGRRLPQPQYCPDKLYDIMQKCWLVDPQDRPTFRELARDISVIVSAAEQDMQQGLLRIDIHRAQFNQIDSAKYHYAYNDTYLEPPTTSELIGGANSANDYMEVFDDTKNVQIYPIGGANGNNTNDPIHDGNNKNEPYHSAYDDSSLETPTKSEPVDVATNNYMEEYDNTKDVQMYPQSGANNKKHEPYYDEPVSIEVDAPGKVPENTETKAWP